MNSRVLYIIVLIDRLISFFTVPSYFFLSVKQYFLGGENEKKGIDSARQTEKESFVLILPLLNVTFLSFLIVLHVVFKRFLIA